MSIWQSVKDVKLDLSGMSDENIKAIINNLETQDIKEILDRLQEEIDKSKTIDQYILLALRITKIVLAAGVIR